MKLLFVGLTPSQAFQTGLNSHGFSFECLKSWPKENLEQNYDIVIVRISKREEISKLSTLKKKQHFTWLAVVVSWQQLENPEFHSSLLENEAKDGVWSQEGWEFLFWFYYQQILKGQHQRSHIELLEKECVQFQEKAEALTQVSNRLLNEFKKDVDLAQNIQRVLRPRFSPHIPGLSLSVKYIPSVGGGGDYYDIFEFGDKKRFGFLLADSKSHGMAAALLSVLLKLRLEEMKNRFPDSKSFVSFVNQEIRAVYAKNPSSMSLLYGVFDRATLSFQFTSAGNLRPILWRRGQPQNISWTANPELGGVEHFEYHECLLQLQPGDFMILYTDGLGYPLKKKNLTTEQHIKELLKAKGLSPEPLQMQNELMGIVDAYTSKKKLKDDLTLIQVAVDEKAMYVAKVEGD
jgi:serine phosphatase RsbU (regulator of sigma subunit)